MFLSTTAIAAAACLVAAPRIFSPSAASSLPRDLSVIDDTLIRTLYTAPRHAASARSAATPASEAALVLPSSAAVAASSPSHRRAAVLELISADPTSASSIPRSLSNRCPVSWQLYAIVPLRPEHRAHELLKLAGGAAPQPDLLHLRVDRGVCSGAREARPPSGPAQAPNAPTSLPQIRRRKCRVTPRPRRKSATVPTGDGFANAMVEHYAIVNRGVGRPCATSNSAFPARPTTLHVGVTPWAAASRRTIS